MSDFSIVTTSLETANIQSFCLRQKAVDVPSDTTPQLLRHVVESMLACLYAAGGVGLAAPQVGIGWRLFLAMERGTEDPPLVLINPRFTDLSDNMVDGREGCLSLPGYVSLKVPRFSTVKVDGLNQFLMPIQLEAHDFLARVIQHEYDHLDGILYIDRLRDREDLALYSPKVRAQKAADKIFSGSIINNETDVNM